MAIAVKGGGGGGGYGVTETNVSGSTNYFP